MRLLTLLVVTGCVARTTPDAAPPDGPEQFYPTASDPVLQRCLTWWYSKSIHECRAGRLPHMGRPAEMSLDDCLRLARRGWPGGPEWPTLRPFGGYEEKCRLEVARPPPSR